MSLEKLCVKCGYQRKPADTAPETECPHCGAVYAKVEAALKQENALPQAEMLQYIEKISWRDKIETWCAGRVWYGRALLLLWLGWIGIEHLRDPLYSSLFGGLNLGIHEAGHLLLRFFGFEFLMVAGGTLLQLAAPIISALMFLRQPDYFALSVCGAWLGTNFYNVATYMADARAQELPLVGWGSDIIHDWHYMLPKLHLLAWDTRLGSFTRLMAFLVMWGSVVLGAWMVWRMMKTKSSDSIATD
ncbi:MAG: zinc ribbon domain-containing protein [Burkholderiales bacterium]